MKLPKVIQQIKPGQIDLKQSLQEKIRLKKMAEIDEATADRTVQAEQTKTAELEAREAEASKRKVDAEVSIAEKAMPPGVWGFLGELLKDRNPQAPMTVQDMLAVIDRVQMQGGAPEQPAQGIYGVLTALITQMGENKQQITPLELIQTIQAMNPPSPQVSQAAQLSELATAFASLKNAFVPAAPSSPQQVGLPGQGVDSQGNPVGPVFNLPIPSILDLFKMDREQKREDRKVEMWQGVTEVFKKEIPRAAGALERQSQRPQRQIGKGSIAPETKQPDHGMTIQTCPDCGTTMGIPKSFKKGDVVLCINPECPSHLQPPEDMEGHRA